MKVDSSISQTLYAHIRNVVQRQILVKCYEVNAMRYTTGRNKETLAVCLCSMYEWYSCLFKNQDKSGSKFIWWLTAQTHHIIWIWNFNTATPCHGKKFCFLVHKNKEKKENTCGKYTFIFVQKTFCSITLVFCKLFSLT